MTDREQHKKRYRTDPEYRERHGAQVASLHERTLADPRTREVYKRLMYLRKKISQRRDQIERQLRKTSEYETDLIEFIRLRDLGAGKLKRLREAPALPQAGNLSQLVNGGSSQSESQQL